MDSTINLNIYDSSHVSARRMKENSIALKGFITLLTFSLFIAVPIAAMITGVSGETFWQNLLNLLTGPSKLVTDYFALGCLASTFFNAGVCGLVCNLILIQRFDFLLGCSGNDAGIRGVGTDVIVEHGLL